MSHTFAKVQVALVKYKGRVDLDGLFDLIFGWIMANQFQNFDELVYKHKMPDIERRWRAWYPRTNYVLEAVRFECHFFGVKPVEIIENGKKKKMYDCRGEMRFSFEIVTDWNDKWESSPFMIKMRNLFDNYVFKKDLLLKHADPLEKNMNKLVAQVKDYLGMEGT
ncbi:MAG: hypothetical protein ACE5DM_05735 [Candidatus Nanoarchaeia archaeon]